MCVERQKRVEQFTQAVGEAIFRIKQDLAKAAPVNVTVVAGSNGTRSIVDVLPILAAEGKIRLIMRS